MVIEVKLTMLHVELYPISNLFLHKVFDSTVITYIL